MASYSGIILVKAQSAKILTAKVVIPGVMFGKSTSSPLIEMYVRLAFSSLLADMIAAVEPSEASAKEMNSIDSCSIIEYLNFPQ